LARGYSELGNYPYAEYHVEQAMQRIEESDPIRGDALVVLGQIGVTRGQWHEAFEHFDRVLRDFAAMHSAIPARLGRAEIHSILGDDERSLADFRKLHAELAAALPRRDVTPQDVGRSLADRHDAALTTDRLPEALEYILLAETFFGAGKVSQEVVFRIASTSRQLADDLIDDARVEQPDASLDELDPTVRFEASEHYRRAGDYYVRHARALAGRPGADEVWADSLWLAADSYDLGGWHDLSIAHFTEYVAGRSDLDPRRPEAVFRLAQAYHAELDYETAARQYEQVLDEHPRSHVASRSHVPLARCLLALGRRPEAERQMIQVISGRSGMEPEALDYRDALIELGSLYYDNEDFVGAIERLHEAVTTTTRTSSAPSSGCTRRYAATPTTPGSMTSASASPTAIAGGPSGWSRSWARPACRPPSGGNSRASARTTCAPRRSSSPTSAATGHGPSRRPSDACRHSCTAMRACTRPTACSSWACMRRRWTGTTRSPPVSPVTTRP